MTRRADIVSDGIRCVARRNAGFTLLEIMLVVVLIGITVTFVNLNLSPDPEKIARREGERVAALLRQMQEESVLRGRPMALEFDAADQRYAFSMVDAGEWKDVADDVFRERHFLRPVRATLEVEGVDPTRQDVKTGDGQQDKAVSRIVASPVGQITPFQMTLRAGDAVVAVGLDAFDDVAVARVEQP